jgi:hypothetical protein
MTMYCKHGICYGFMLLAKHESPANVFRAYWERFKEGNVRSRCGASLCGSGPGATTYDMACLLHVYCINREPWFFRRSTFWVDTLHYGNHTACSEGYSTARLRDKSAHGNRQQDPYINSQIAEQGNAALRHIANQLSFMTMPHYILFLRLFLGAWNERKRQTLHRR